MAKMFPVDGPQNTDSSRAEPNIYWQLSKELSDEFIVIHSLPWLASVAREIDGRPVPTGEIDFVVIHKNLGILAVEVKGGVLSYDRTEFVYKRTGQKIEPIRQVRRGTHALAKWLHNSGVGSWRIGYCILLPQSEISNKAIPIALVDSTVESPQPIILGMESLTNLGQNIQSVMSYWQDVLRNKPIREKQLKKLIDIILPSSDYSPCWQTIIENDVRTWLRLRPEQSECLRRINREDRFVVTGLPGTGKTLLLIEHARRLSASGKKILIIAYNDLLTRKLREELPNADIEVCTFHEQCRRAARAIGVVVPTYGRDRMNQIAMQEWYSTGANEALDKGIEEEKLKIYDALIVDEGQALDIEWWHTLTRWFKNKQVVAFCDPTQSFAFECSSSGEKIADVIGAGHPYVLTINLRSPKAVFDRISEAKPSTYQQLCLRPPQPGALTEIVVENMRNALNGVIDQLQEDNIPNSSIVIIDTTPESERQNSYRGIQSVSSARFRGLESPVVIVWAGIRSDETSIFCAYTRATSRCIVIYDAVEVIKGNYGAFGEIISGLDELGDIEQEAKLGLTSGIFEAQNFSLLSVAERTIRLYWCSNWNGWIIFPSDGRQIEQAMWLYHLIFTTRCPVFSWNMFDRGTLQYSEPIDDLKDGSRKRCQLAFCECCKILTPFETLVGDKLGGCLVCSQEKYEISSSECDIQSRFDQTLSEGKQAEKKMKRDLSISLIALGRWRSIPIYKKKAFEDELVVGGSVGYGIAYLLVLTDLILTTGPENMAFSLRDTAERYREKWCPDLVKRIDKKSWQSLLALGFNTWLQHEMIQKVSKGLYRKTGRFYQKMAFNRDA